MYLDASGNGVWNGQIGGDIENTFGVAGDVPVTGDWDGDGSDEIGVQRSNVFHLDRNGNGVWNNSTGGDLSYTYGDPGDQPLHGKWLPVSPSYLMAAGGAAEVASQAPPLTAECTGADPAAGHHVLGTDRAERRARTTFALGECRRC